MVKTDGPGNGFWRAARLGCAALALGLSGVISALVAVPTQARAETRDFEAALAQWLADDEAAALPALAGMAAEGDMQARLLLGLIDKNASLQGPWLTRRTRAERLALMRAPSGGLSGQSWLRRIDGVPLAALWLELLQVGTGFDTVEALTRTGEVRTARQAVLTMAMREELRPQDSWPDWLDPELAWAVWPFAGEELRGEIAELVPEAHPQWALMGRTVAGNGLDDWLRDSAAARPLQQLCATHCAHSAASCRIAGYHALGSHAALLTLGSPAEALVPGDTFLSSPRGQQAILRRMLLSTDMRGRAALLARTQELDPCLAALLVATAEAYRPGRTTTSDR